MRRGEVAVCAVVAAVLGTLAAADAGGVRVNVTPSMPVGLWKIESSLPFPARGEVVTVCLPEGDAVREAIRRGYVSAGACPGGSEPLVKPVAAIGGDLVVVSTHGITVNGAPVPSSVPLAQDEAGRALRPVPAGLYRVARDTVWLLSRHDPRSFDSRYFGTIPIANVRDVARPLWVWR
ncbi:conjugative transfer signal peptidase TraF [Rhodovastum sp. RN2-1]|uniref:Conjugative transfer signal peptidase TraF n=2 Tax=Limobrevibacterium gyesilva TaxID=2991712 RepID=A0AA42CF78_9PROT|nr:conjugative transfer signal peptidase TraF [Limobrevibacterium gyesilva]MCW3476239.1 conjugative transfer signal peptidase TraF [Limobrevibacterium gyesilva]